MKSSARSRYTQQFKRLQRNTRLRGGFYRGKPIKLKDDEVNGKQKKRGIDNVPSFVRPLTPGLCIQKSTETFLNCFKRERGVQNIEVASILLLVCFGLQYCL